MPREDGNAEPLTEDMPTVPEVIESLGVGVAQYRTALVAGAIWLADGAELLLISSVAESVAGEWHMSSFQQSAVVSLVFIGVGLGNFLGGPLSDAQGRRVPLLISYACIVVFSILSACSWGFTSLGVIRLLVGISFGVGQPASMTLVNEITPENGRILMNCLIMTMFSFGEIYSGLLLFFDDPNLLNLHWRSLLVLGAIPSFVFGVLAYFFLYQSPLHLACCGQLRETREVLAAIRRENRREHLPVDFRRTSDARQGGAPEEKPVEVSLLQQLAIIVGRQLFGTTMIVGFSCFILNLIFYGCLYAFPQIMTEVDMGGAPAVNLIVGALWEIVGYVITYFVAVSRDRIPVIKVYLCLTAISLVLFILGAPRAGGADSSWIWTVFLYAGYYGIKFFPAIGFIVIYVYANEVYPTAVRASGSAFVLASGRLAAILAPVLYEAVLDATGHFVYCFWGIVALTLTNLLLTFFLTVETAGRTLQDQLEPLGDQKCFEYGAAGSASA
jgi:putative MFS transporter